MRDDIFILDERGNKQLSLSKLIGGGYTDAWFTNCRVRYRLFCGARSTKKSYNIIGCEPIIKILSDPRRNILIARQNDSDNRQSTFENITGRIIDLGLENSFKISKNPLTIEYTATGQQIIFRGLNNPTSLNGITFAHGYFTDAYIDEAFEIPTFEDFRKLDGSIRGKLPGDLFFQITMCFNAWDGESWLNEEFFKGRLDDDYEMLDRPEVQYLDYFNQNFIGPYGRGLYLHKSTYKINEFRAADYDLSAQEMKRKSPKIYQVEFLGMFGNTGSSVYDEFNDSLILPLSAFVGSDNMGRPAMQFYDFAIGIDIGLSDGEGKKIKVGKNEDATKKVRAATTMSLCAVTSDLEKMVVIDEYYHSNNAADNACNTDDRENLGLPAQADRIMQYIAKWFEQYGGGSTILMNGQVNVYVDSADVGARAVLEMKAREWGFYNLHFFGSTKISIQSRIDFWRLMMAYSSFLVCDKCKNLIREIKNARRGKKGEARADVDDHILTATEYGFQPIIGQLKRWRSFKIH